MRHPDCENPELGARTSYTRGCRCPTCTDANSAYMSEYYARNKEKVKRSVQQHRERKPLYKRWVSMIARCCNPNANGYEHWGGRGITVCKEWRESFEAYEQYVTSLPGFDLRLACGEDVDRKDKIQLDRIDNDGNYEPGNLRWVKPCVNMKNRRPKQ